MKHVLITSNLSNVYCTYRETGKSSVVIFYLNLLIEHIGTVYHRLIRYMCKAHNHLDNTQNVSLPKYSKNYSEHVLSQLSDKISILLSDVCLTNQIEKL